MREFLSRLREKNIRLRLTGEELSIRHARGQIDGSLLEEIQLRKMELIEYLKSIERTDHSRIPHAGELASYPLSSAQRRLWVLSQFPEASIAYNMTGAYIFEGSLDQHALEGAFEILLGRHEILRTVFREDELGEIRQIILRPEVAAFEIVSHDLQQDERNEDIVRARIQFESTRQFILSEGPLLRAFLYHVADGRWIFAYVIHHIISDGWSMGIFIKELQQAYNAILEGVDPQLPRLAIQYKDYAFWQQKELSSNAFQAHKEYWTKQFEGDVPVLDLPVDNARGSVKTYTGGLVDIGFDPKLSDALRSLGREQGATIFMSLVALVNVLLFRYTGQEDIVTGTPIAGREREELEHQIGLYINTLALRSTFSGDQPFRDLLNNVKLVCLKGFEHQAYPFDELTTTLNIHRDMSRGALFDVMVVLQNAAMHQTRELELGGLNVKEYGGTEHVASKFDLTFNFIESGPALRAAIEFDSQIYEKSTVEKMGLHLVQLLQAIVASPSTPIGQLDYLSRGEKESFLQDGKDAYVDYPREKTIVDLFEEQAVRTPDCIAVVYGETRLTYRELNEQSNQLADRLKKQYDIQPDDLVGIRLRRGEGMIIAMLGILKSGGAYVPIDPEYPAERINYIISDSMSRLVIDEDVLNSFISTAGEYHSGNPPHINKPGDLAYVIYTSGTTGNPKGALIEHGNVVRLFKTEKPLFYFDESDVWTMFHSYCFDFSVWEIYGALFFGGRLILVPEKTTRDPGEFRALMIREGVTVLNQTPSAFYNLIRADLENEGAHLRLRYVIFGGDALAPAKLSIWNERYPDTKLINMYGITETTVHVTYKEINRYEIDHNISNIGRPIPTLACYILDRHQRLLPAGIPGELYVGGDGVCRGYLNRPALTSQRFIADPFRAGGRLYRSGDKVKMLKNGEMEYLGRMDDQVKIRGYRIELGEIEEALRALQFVEDAVVLSVPGGEGEAQLVAYLISKQQLNAYLLRSRLVGSLPAYMIPSHFVQLEQFPLTKNGKLDKKCLLGSAGESMSTGMQYIPPGNPTESAIVGIWEGILKREKIGVRDSFFDLGGDSIKVLRMMTLLRKELSLEVPIGYIYKHNTIEDIAAYSFKAGDESTIANRSLHENESIVRRQIETLRENVLASPATSAKENIEDVLPMSAIEKGMLFGFLANEGLGVYHDQFIYQRTFYDFRKDRMILALRLLMGKHSILRTCFNIADYDTEVQLVYKDVAPTIGYYDVSDADPEQQDRIIQEFLEAELRNSFDIAIAPLWRMTIFRLGETEYKFVWQFHHAILDGWSNASFITELNNVYLRLGEDPEYRPDGLDSGYRDFVVRHEIDQRDGDVRAFWKQELSGYQRMDLFSNEEDFRVYSKVFDKQYLRKLENTAIEWNTTVKAICLSAYLCALKMLQYENDLIIGLVTNTRPDFKDSDKILGCFLNTTPLRMMVDLRENCQAFAGQVNEKLIGLKDKERLSLFEISLLHGENPEAGNPFFDVLFNFVDFHVYDHAEIDTDDSAESEGKGVAGFIGGNERTNTFLDCTVGLTGGRCVVSFRLSKKLRSGFSVEKFGDLYGNILTKMVEMPYSPVSEIARPTAAESLELVEGYKGAECLYGGVETLVGLFESSVLFNRDGCALVFGDRSYSYGELNEWGNRLGGYLRAVYDIGRDDLIGLKVERSDWAVICMLGILKSGAGCVPMDVSYPQERIDQMREGSGCKLLLDEAELLRFREVSGLYGSDDLPLINGSCDLAYVIYTSGSTGEPKGCMLEQLGVINHLYSKVDLLGAGGMSVICHSSELHFVGGIWQLWGPLITGGKVVLSDREELRDMGKLLLKARVYGAGVLEVVPSQLNEYLSYEGLPEWGGIGKLILTGEKLSPYFVEKCYKSGPQLEIINTYGQTESSDVTTFYRIPRTGRMERVFIGGSIRNMRNYILSPEGSLCPVGVVGEICTSGMGVSRGYVNNAEETGLRFVADVYGGGGRMYRTGDLGRRLPDGQLEILGRKDEQVKIRGHRIELNEIEGVLEGYSGVEEAAVLLEDTGGEKSLWAYIVSKGGLEVEGLRSYLGSRLPVYMLPSRYVEVAGLPLLGNGKIDRHSLRRMGGRELVSGVGYEAAVGDTEQKLVTIWERVLQREGIGVRDNFFGLGGHSLKATRLASQVHKELGVKLSLREIFGHPVLRDLARVIEVYGKTMFRPIVAVEGRPCYPLSSAQRRLWILSQFEGASVAYNIPGIYSFDGDVNIPALSFAFSSLIGRHEILRTVFREDGEGEVRQFIYPAETLEYRLQYVDLWQGHIRENGIRIMLEKDLLAPFDLRTGPLLRAVLYRISPDKWVLAYVMHHIISDGWSMDILLRELLLLYNAYCSGNPSPLSALRIQYKDYASWQLQELAAGGLNVHKRYWMEQLSGELPVLELMGDKTRPALKTYNGGAINHKITQGLSDQLKMLSLEMEGTLFMALLAGVNALLYKYTGQKDMIVGSPIAGRGHADLEDQIGFYVNTMILRTRFDGSDNYRQLFRIVKKMTLDAYEHQAYPFDELVDELKLTRDMSRNPLFDVMVVMQNTGTIKGEASRLGEIQVSGYEGIDQVISKFDLSFTFTELADGLQVNIEYNSDIYNRDTIVQLVHHLEQLLDAIVEAPSTSIDELHYLREEEIRVLTDTFNDTKFDGIADKTITELFQQQAAMHSGDVAVIFGDVQLTYGEMAERSGRLGQYLRENYHILPGDRVGIMLDRSEWLVIAILGVLRSGGAYVPLDPEYPQSRKDFIIADSGCKAVIDEAELAAFSSSVERYGIDPQPDTKAGDLAYIIYTSGSTGQPKGCMLEHRGVVNRLEWMWHALGFDNSDIILQKTNFTFDVSVWELLMPLCWGAKMVICPREDAGAPLRILSLIERRAITCLHFVPGMLQAYVTALLKEEHLGSRMRSVRRVITSGEALAVQTVKKWYGILDIPIQNLYGPTEASIDVSFYPVSKQDSIIPIGKPIWNTQLYITDKFNQLKPVGVKGEICIGGTGVARGYLNRPELTAEQFVANPFRRGERMYRTGDWGRWLPDGNVEFIGRMDDQVKIRGHRVELAEIGKALQGHEAIDSAVVLAMSDKDGDQELVAYFTGRMTFNVQELRSFLGRTLPAYMVPVRYVHLEEMPLTPSGKLDRKKLPDLRRDEMHTGMGYTAPRNEIENRLAAIWEEVLDRQHVGINDNFFDLGGTSLKLIKMISLINRSFHRSISIVTAFRLSSIVALSEYIYSHADEVKEHELDLEMAISTMEETMKLYEDDGQ